ncbi:unnamed protein product [Polarella glacialis]|uniref:Membrane transport protein MMPL domain-containing protein n=1 Tax=Polarella glacialis TaxID=89957 RepID=A0A813EPL0_POLGL|nr:unnamed protein product [Polarella glacialis]
MRAVASMEEVGPAVLMGALTTLVATLPLGLATSIIFRTFFKCMIGINVLGSLHGLVFMPAVLALAGDFPCRCRKNDQRANVSLAGNELENPGLPEPGSPTGTRADRIHPAEESDGDTSVFSL